MATFERVLCPVCGGAYDGLTCHHDVDTRTEASFARGIKEASIDWRETVAALMDARAAMVARIRHARDILLGASSSMHIPPTADGQMEILYPAVEEAIAELDGIVGAPYSDAEMQTDGRWRDAKGALPLNPCPNIWHEQSYSWTLQTKKYPVCPICKTDRKYVPEGAR